MIRVKEKGNANIWMSGVLVAFFLILATHKDVFSQSNTDSRKFVPVNDTIISLVFYQEEGWGYEIIINEKKYTYHVIRQAGANLLINGCLDYWNMLKNYNVRASFHGHTHNHYRAYDCDGLYDITIGGGAELHGIYGYDDPYNFYYGYQWILVTVNDEDEVTIKMHFIYEGHSPNAEYYD